MASGLAALGCGTCGADEIATQQEAACEAPCQGKDCDDRPCLGETGGGGAQGHLTSAGELAVVRDLADRGVEPHHSNREALVRDASLAWRWGSISGRFVTSVDDAGDKRCHPRDDPAQTRYLKDGAPDVYARVLAFQLTGSERFLAGVRERILDLVDTSGFHGIGAGDHGGGNQCVLDLAVSIPVWLESALLLEGSPAWSEADAAALKRWLAREVYPRVAWASRVRINNWGSAGSLAASLVAGYVEDEVSSLSEVQPVARTLSPATAYREHVAMQLTRAAGTWRGDSRCDLWGIQEHGGIPDELRRGSTGCDGRYLVEDDRSWSYQTMHVEHLVFHAEALRRRGIPDLFDLEGPGGAPAILQAILFVVDNTEPGARSWPWKPSRESTLRVANAHYRDPRLDAADTGTYFRAGRTLPYARVTHPR